MKNHKRGQIPWTVAFALAIILALGWLSMGVLPKLLPEKVLFLQSTTLGLVVFSILFLFAYKIGLINFG